MQATKERREIGATFEKDGYVWEKVSAGRDWQLQHRLVMERRLGRPLRRDEEVHHKSGVRNDNRDDNLELWTSSQPSGQRVADLVEWAKEILARYEHERH